MDSRYRISRRTRALEAGSGHAQRKVGEPRPAVVIVHGGGWRSGDKRAHIWARYPVEYAERGFVAISVNYRLLPDDPFPACIEDVKIAVRWLRAHAAFTQHIDETLPMALEFFERTLAR